MALIPQLSTGIPTPKNVLLHQGAVNRSDTTAKNLFMLRKGEVLVAATLYGNNNSNAGTTATLAIGGIVKNNAGSAIGDLYGVSMTSLGSGYTSAPTVAFTGGAGSGATGVAQINAAGQVVGVIITNFGTGYTTASPPTIAFTGGAGANAAATALVTDLSLFHSGIDVKTAATGKGQQYVNGAAGLYIPVPYDVMVTATYAETGTASTAGGPWYIQFNTYTPGPGEVSRAGGFFPST